MTFTFDQETADRLRRLADRLGRPQSQIVREAVLHYSQTGGRLNEEERQQKLAIMDRIIARGPTRTRGEVDAEIQETRASRRLGGRRHPADR